MRDRQEIEQEMFHAREDLEQNLGELKQTVREKVDVPDRIRHVIADKKQQAGDLARRGVDFAKERPVLVGGIAAGVIAGIVGTILLLRFRGRNRSWWEKAYDLI